MIDYISKLHKICDIIFTTLHLDIYAVTNDFEVLVNLFHEANPDELSKYWRNYLSEAKWTLESEKPFSCFWHVVTDCSLIFLDIRIQTPEGSNLYLVLGPALTKVFDDSFFQSLVNHQVLSLKAKTAAVKYFKSIPFLSTKTKNAFWISYQLLLQLSQFEEFSIDVPTVGQTMLSPDTFFKDQAESEITKDEILLNYALEAKWRAYISAGDSRSAKNTIGQMVSNDFTYRHPTDPFRTIKNVQLSVNTLCRAAACDGGAFPTDVHHTHEMFAIRIENAENIVDIEQIYSEMVDTYCNLVVASKTRAFSPPVKNAIAYLYNHYDEPVTLHTLAKEINYSEGHLSRIFQKETGKTVGVYLNELRIDHACKLLQTQSCSITDTAMLVGFSSYAKFSVEFKKYTGMCASDYLHGQNV